MELVGMLEQQKRGHCTAEGETLDADLVRDDVRQALEILRPGHEILDGSLGEVAEVLVGTCTAVMPCHAGVGGDGDDAVVAPPLAGSARAGPTLADVCGIRTSVNLEMHRVFLRRVEVDRVCDGRGDDEAVVGSDTDHLRQGIFRGVEIPALHVRDLESRRGVTLAHPAVPALSRGHYPAGAPGHSGIGCLVKPHLGRSGKIRHGHDEPAAVRRETHSGGIVVGIGQSCDDPLAVDLVQGCLGRIVAVGHEVDVPGLLVHSHYRGPPVRAVGQAPELGAVIGQIIYLLPPGFESPDHIQAFLPETHLLRPVQPGRVFLVIDMLLGSVGRIHAIQVELVLETGLPRHEESLAVRTPERNAEILVLLLVEIRPGNPARGQVDYTDAHLGVCLAGFRITRPVQGTVLPEGRIDRKHRHSGIVETVEAYLARVGGPPEGTVHRRPAEDFLVVDP